MIAPRTVIALRSWVQYDARTRPCGRITRDSADRKTWELIFRNTQNGINWAHILFLVHRKQRPLLLPARNTLPRKRFVLWHMAD